MFVALGVGPLRLDFANMVTLGNVMGCISFLTDSGWKVLSIPGSVVFETGGSGLLPC